MKKFLSIAIFFIFNHFYAQTSDLWQKIEKPTARISKREGNQSLPTKYDLYQLNIDLLKLKLQNARKDILNSKPVIVDFPSANGEIVSYEIYENTIMAPQLGRKYTNIKSYIGVNTQNPSVRIQFTTTVFGLHAQGFSEKMGSSYIEPLNKNTNEYLVYSSRSSTVDKHLNCQVKNSKLSKRTSNRIANANRASDGNFRKFRLALSCTKQYSDYHIARASLINGTSAQKREAVLAAMVITISRVNTIFEKDLGIKLELVSRNDELISIENNNFTTQDGNDLLRENQLFIDSKIGNGSYDIGHVFSAGNTGIAEEGSVCVSQSKAKGVTGTSDPVGDAFDVDYVAHEMGHQFGASHTFNGSIGSNSNNIGTCDAENFSGSTAVETGSGSTIMGYAGICQSINVQQNSDPYFSFISIEQINDFLINNASCAVTVTNTNPKPVINALQNYTIPKSTPFVLDASVANTNSSTFTYCWEQNDVEESVQPPVATSTVGPLFRSFSPSQNSFRYFPSLETVIDNSTQNIWEVVPSVARTMNFVLTVRDNGVVNGGLTANAGLRVNVVDVAPFLVTSPNTNVSWEIDTNQTVTWNVGGTNANGINTTSVDIYMSSDGGVTFPTVLAMNVPNDGSQEITVPDAIGTQNRIMVKGHDTIFYDVSNTNCTIIETTNPSFRLKTDVQTISQCDGIKAVDAKYRLLYTTIAGFTGSTALSATGNPSGSVLTFSKNNLTQNENIDLTISNLGSVPSGTYEIIVTGISGAITKRLSLYLEINSSIFPKVKLIAPANFKETPPNDLVFTWENNVGIPLYEIEIATDEDFTSIVETATVKTNAYISTKLENGIVYFWRVLPKNKGCKGEFSEIFQFKTVFCNSFSSENRLTSSQIPYRVNNNSYPAFSEVYIKKEKGIIIDNLNAYVEIRYPSIEFLSAKIISPIGTQVVLFENQCFDQRENVRATFSDEGDPIICGLNPAISGLVKPQESLSKFYGESSRGIWRLEVDYKGKRTEGAIENWVLNICTNQKEVDINTTTSQMTLYPNPSEGSFNVEMDNVKSKKVTVFVFDTSGRRIYGVTYNSKEYFNQNIQLNLAAGMYLVTTLDGDREETKKLIVK